ncbi:cag pathogenicity island Cag12 family protein [Pectobacterium versatile]|uniref:cag pathogenicity island Cag12 family protein n=1 Tax=Pectobacterium versatile TaxID=2488639 RepID=UPI001CF27A3D|nr:cag pathogenicity island Cag12 family protein [Pectobacterium versatile]MCA6938448.1 cag pathogenicity island Cag12 family protein [Pectobacterium versatile]
MMKVINMLLFSLALSGCSSPPLPVPVEWDKPGQSVNTGLPQWRDNPVIIPSPMIKDKWLLSIHARNFNETHWTPAVFYSVAHSARIVVAAPSGAEFFTAKNWLRRYGAKGVIEYQPVSGCMKCSDTRIYFSH